MTLSYEKFQSGLMISHEGCGGREGERKGSFGGKAVVSVGEKFWRLPAV
jgi:hypothetical protein